jgi:vWA-MoxR associated protein C-terminal domain/Effector-associated domain 9
VGAVDDVKLMQWQVEQQFLKSLIAEYSAIGTQLNDAIDPVIRERLERQKNSCLKQMTDLAEVCDQLEAEILKKPEQIFQVVQNEVEIPILDSRQQVQSYLMIKVEPAFSGNKKLNKLYFVKAWFIANEQEYTAKSGTGVVLIATAEDEDSIDTEKVFTIAEIERIIPVFIYNSTKYGKLPNTTIELFLPDELLNESIDNWKMDDGNLVYSIGSKYKIILRSTDRLPQKQLRLNGSYWQKKWNNMPKPGARQSTGLLVAGDSMSRERLVQELNPSHIMGLTFVENSLQIGKDSPIAVLRDAGAPIAMWLRQPLPNVDQTTIDSLLACCLHNLPSVVKQQRLAAITEAPGSHIGHHLALLWDSFDRLPPDLDFYMS